MTWQTLRETPTSSLTLPHSPSHTKLFLLLDKCEMADPDRYTNIVIDFAALCLTKQ